MYTGSVAGSQVRCPSWRPIILQGREDRGYLEFRRVPCRKLNCPPCRSWMEAETVARIRSVWEEEACELRHAFVPEERELYRLERLWGDAPVVLRVQ